jgi:hypothetical protein
MRNRRKHVRHEVDYVCWLGGAGAEQLIEGQVRNISEGGAKIVCRAPADVPDTFNLFMTQDGKVGRRCKVIWRLDDAIGLMFLAGANSARSERVEV